MAFMDSASRVCRYIPLQAIGDRLLGQLEVQRWGECRVSPHVTSCRWQAVGLLAWHSRRGHHSLLQATYAVTLHHQASVNGGSNHRVWSQGTLLGLLAAYNYEAGILAAAARLLCGDAARDLAAAYRSRLRGRPAAVPITAAAGGSPTVHGRDTGGSPRTLASPPHMATGLGTRGGGGDTGPEDTRRKMALLELS
jgi:hypothetical protein